MDDRLSLLVVDANADGRARIADEIARAFPELAVEAVSESEEFDAVLAQGAVDLAVVDTDVSWGDGETILARLRDANPGLPAVLFTGDGTAAEAVEGGPTERIPRSETSGAGLIRSIQRLLDLRQTRDVFREGRRSLETLMSNLPGMVYRCRNDARRTMMFVSRGCLAITGHVAEDLILNGKVAYADLIVSEDRASVGNEVQAALEAGRPFEMRYRIRKASGDTTWVWEHGCGIHDDEGRLVALEGFITDIAARQDGAPRLQRVHEIYREAIQNAQGIPYELRFDDYRYAFFAEGIETLLGRKVESLTQREFESYVEEIVVTDPEAPPSWLDYSDGFLHGGIERWRADYRIRGADGVVRWVSDCSTPIRDETTGEVVGSLGILHDITERRRAEEKTRETNRFLTILSAIARAIAFSRTPEALCEALANELRGVVPLDAFYMEAFRPNTGKGLGLGNFDTIDGVFQRVPLIRAEVDRRRGPLGATVYASHRPMVIHRTPEELEVKVDRGEHGLVVFGNVARRSASLAYLPLIVGERVIGVMSAQSYTLNAYGSREVELLTAIAGQVAPAVEGALLGYQMLKNSELLRAIVTGTSKTTGRDFFRALVRHLAEAFGVRHALLGELAGPSRARVSARAVWAGDSYADNFDFDLEGSLLGGAREGEIRLCREGAREQYPRDAVLERFQSVGCMGIRLYDSAGTPLGVLEVMHPGPLEDDLDLDSILRVFAARAAAEIERLHADEALRSGEQKYRNLFENALVGVFRSRLSDGLILEANQQMMNLAGFQDRSEYVGVFHTSESYIDPGTRERMVRMIQEQGEVDNFEARIRRPDGRIIWIQYSAKLYREEGHIEGIAFDVTRRKETEQALRETNETLQAVVRASPLAIVGYGLDQRVLMWNPAAERIFGWKKEEVAGVSQPLIPQLELDNLAALQRRGERERGFSGLELRRRRKDGTEVDVSLSMASLRDSNGRVTGAVAIISDITEKKRLETERETFAWLSLQLVEADTLDSLATVVTQALDTLFQFDAMNMVRRSPDQDVFLPIRVMDIIDGSRRVVPGTTFNFEDCRTLGRLLEGEPYLINRQSPDENPLSPFGDTTRRSASLLYASIMLRGEVFGILSVQSYQPNRYGPRDLRLLKAVTDILAPALRRAQAEADLRRSEARNRALLDAMPDVIFVMDAEGTFRDYKASRDQLLLPPEQFIGRRAVDVLPTDLAEITMTNVRRAVATGHAQNFEYQLVVEDRTREYEARMVRSETDEVLVIVRDITDRKQLEAQLRQALKMEAIGRLAGGIAHDFNNLLTGIVGNLGIAQMDASPEIQPILDEAMTASQRAAGLVSQLLAFGRKTHVTIQPFDLAPIAREVVGIVRNTFDRRIEIVLRKSPDLWPILGDPGQIHQVLLNLMVNARDALTPLLNSTPTPLLRIAIDADNFEADEEYSAVFPYARPGPYVVLSVTDTGVGMDAETRKQIFEPFFTTKKLGKGTGLGLATTYGIVKQHNGWINVYSEPGRGSTFRVYLPAAESAQAPAGEAGPIPGPEEVLPMPGGPETILVVDDEAFIRRLSRRILEPLGYTILDASDGEEALQRFQRRDHGIDLILLDLSMPRLSGQETLARLRAEGHSVKVILSSGYAYVGDLPEQMGAVEYISKPYRPAELAQLVRKVLDA